jgi:cation-transporting ATPase 13A3/4/5
MSQAMWVFIDGCTVPLSWALTIAQPASKLIKSRPTARLLGFETMFSVIGQLVINAGILGLTASLLYDQSFFRCFEFDSSFVDLRLWWQLADNYEGSITGIITAFQILHVSCALNIGSKYRNGFAKNKIFIMIYTTLFMILSYVLLVDPNPIGCHFHINCGTKETLEDLGYTVWFNTPSEYFNATGHNVIPRNFRFVLFLLVVLNLALVMIWEGIIIQGPVREWAKSWANGRWQVKKIPLNE